MKIKILSRLRDGAIGAILVLGTASLLGWNQSVPEVQRARSFEVLDKDGKVRAKIVPGLMALYNTAGKERARVTSDENNGNLVLFGEGGKRLEVYMDAETPRAVFFNPSGQPTAVFPPPVSDDVETAR